MSLTWNPSLYPPCGYVFKDAEGIEHTGKNIEDLALKVAEYRIRRELPPGNPVAEVHEYLCGLYPKRCQPNDPPKPGILTRTRNNALMLAVVVWLREVWRRVAARQLSWASEDEVRVRVAACLKCPHHTRASVDCPACQESLNAVSFQLRAGRDRHSGQLSTCRHYQRDARVDVLLAEPMDLKDPNAPACCWKHPEYGKPSLQLPGE